MLTVISLTTFLFFVLFLVNAIQAFRIQRLRRLLSEAKMELADAHGRIKALRDMLPDSPE